MLAMTRRRIVQLALGSAGGLLLAACGQAAPTPAPPKPVDTGAPKPAAPAPSQSGNPEPTKPAAAPAATTAPPAASAPAPAATTAPAAASKPAGGTPKAGGQSVWAILADPLSLDQHKAGSDVQADVLGQFYESLTSYNAKLEVIPWLATSWETPDPSTYVFKLRQGVKFHNGQEMTADDVKYSVERMLAKDTADPWLFTLETIDQVTAVDKYTVKMAMKKPDPGIPGAFATNRGHGIMPAGAHQKVDLATKAIGTGPFKLAEYVSASHVIAERFPDYWNAPMPYIEKLTFKILGDEEARVAGVRAKQLDGSQIAFESISRLSGDASIQILKSDVYSPYTLEPNSGRAPTSDVRVRRAISMAIDRNAYIEKVVGGNGTLTGPIATGYGDWFIPPDQLGYKYDPEGAKKLLAEAGVAPGTVLSFPYQGDNPFYSAIGVVTADQLKKIGLDVKLEPVEAGVLTARGPSRSRDYHLYTRRRGFRHDPDAHLRADFHSTGSSNPGYKNAEVDDLLDKARGELDHAKRKEMYTRIQRIILDENPHVFLFNTIKVDALQGYVKGYEPQYTAFRETLRQTWLDK